MTFTQITSICSEFRLKYGIDFEQHFLLTSDWHFDNPKCNRLLLFRHLNLAKELNAPVLVFGDLFCAMQGKFDKRSSKSAVRPEHQTDNYLDALVDTTADALKDYKGLIKFISPGNHETGIKKRFETDLTARLCEKIGAVAGTYAGWIRFKCEHESGGRIRSFNLSYHHGYGGGGAVTKDIIQTNRKAVYLKNADIVVSGHSHDHWLFPIERVELNREGNLDFVKQWHVKTATYKEEYETGNGWHIETGKPPKPLGSVLMKIRNEAGHIKLSFEILY